MESKPFYCKVVGMRITGDVCETRIKQAKEFRAKGEPHASLNKCIICKGLAPTVPAPVPEGKEICSHCKRPRVHKKLRWAKKHGMHVNCYYTLSKKGTAEVEVPVPDVTVKVVEPPEDPERIIQCSASPSWTRCHECYAVKNCALYDAAVIEGVIVASIPAPTVEQPMEVGLGEPPTERVPDTTEQDHYTRCKIQPIEFIVANKMDFLEGNIIKYVARYKNKNGLEDLAKARHYLDMLIEREEAAAL